MILAPHILVGAAIGSKFASLPGIIALSIFVHYLLDIIPHYDYNIDNIKKSESVFDKKFLQAFSKIVLDFLAGTAIVMFLTLNSQYKVNIFAGLAAALLPDFLFFIFMRRPNLPIIRPLAIFHIKIQWFKKIAKPNFIGLATQAAIAIISIIILAN